MCGVAGYVLTGAPGHEGERLRCALNVMDHRGPDDEGLILVDTSGDTVQDLLTADSAPGVARGVDMRGAPPFAHRVAFGHRRYSLVDTSVTGHQPFWSDDEQVCVAFNGEIYNYVELREELTRRGHAFRTASDTEVLVAAYRQWGVECFDRFNGFWALCLYDRSTRRVLLARDRLGKAPLYVTRAADGLFWASEIKGLMAMLPHRRFEVRGQAVADFMRWSRRDLYDETFYEGITSFPRATWAWVEPDANYKPVRWWRIPEQRRTAAEFPLPDAMSQLEEVLDDAVRIRLHADVPVAFQLSGGMDSSTLLALAAGHDRTVDAYTVAYGDPDVDEEPYARQVVEHLARDGRDNISYTVIDPPDDDLLEHADRFIALMGEPFHSPNQFTNHRIWTTMKERGYRGVVYGAGGDEVFAGYSSDYLAPYLRSLLKRGRLPRFINELIHCSDSPHDARAILRHGYHVLPRSLQLLRNPRWVVPAEHDPLRTNGAAPRRGPSEEINRLLVEFMSDWRMNYWLRIDNQNSMGVPLEVRCPLLDYRVVELGFTLPLEYLIRDGWTKWILRRIMSASPDEGGRLPNDVAWRRVKRGFPFPLDDWLVRHRDRILAMIRDADCPFIDMPTLVRSFEPLRQKRADYLWSLISLAMWWRRCVEGASLAGTPDGAAV